MKKSELIKIVKESIQEVTEQAYGHATLTTQGPPNQSRAIVGTDEYPFSAKPKARLPGIWEEDEKGPSYDEVYLKGKLAPFGVYSEYNKDRGQLEIYPDVEDPMNKTRASQYITFRLEEGELQFVHAFGYESTYHALKSVFPELPQRRGSSYSGFMNVLTDQGSIPVDIDTAKEMIQAMRQGKDAEAEAQSAFYTRQPGTGGTGIDEDMEEQAPPPYGTPSGQPDQPAAKGTGQAAKKGPKSPKPKKHKYDPDDLQKKQAELLQMQYENMKVDIYNMKQNIRYINKTKSSAEPKQQAQISKQVADQKKQLKQLKKQLKQLKKQISDMKKTKTKGTTTPQKEWFAKTTAKSLLDQYEQERGSSNLREHMKSHKKLARRQMLMEGAMKKFFEYFDIGNTNEEIVQLYAQKGVSVPEQFVSKARSQYESLKKLKLELETSEQNFKDVSKMMVNNAIGEPGGPGGKTLASGLTK